MGTELLVLFQKYHVPCTYGVVPYTSGEFSTDPANCVPLDQATAEKLNDAVRCGLVEIAVHGFTHHANSVTPSSPDGKSEFRGLDYSSQLRMLTAGRRALENLYQVSATTFIPPWSSYDENTLRALDDLGFKVLSGSSHTGGIAASGRPQRLQFLPATCGLDPLQEAVGAARKSSDAHPAIVVILHPDDFVAFDRDKGRFTYRHFGDLLSWLAAQTDVATETLGGAAMLAQDMGHRRLEAFSALKASQKMAPSFLCAKGSTSFYPSCRLALRMRIADGGRLVLFYLLLTAVTAVLAGFAASLVFSIVKLGTLPRIAEFASVGLLGLYVIYCMAVRSHRAVRHRSIMVLAGLLGVCLGTWVSANAHWMRTPWK